MLLAATTTFLATFFTTLYLILLISFSSSIPPFRKAEYASFLFLTFSFTSSFHHQTSFILLPPLLDVPRISIAAFRIHSAIAFHTTSASSTYFQIPSSVILSDGFIAFSLVRFNHLTLGSPTLLFFRFECLNSTSNNSNLCWVPQYSFGITL